MGHPSAGWLAVGLVRRPHGIHGEVLVEVETDFPDRLAPGLEVGIGAAVPERRLTIHRLRMHKGCWLLSFEGLRTIDEVEELRGQWLFLPEQEREALPATYFYEHELAGLACEDTRGGLLGRVEGLADLGGGSLLRVAAGGREVLVPFRSPIVVRVALAEGRVVVDPPAGLFDDQAL